MVMETVEEQGVGQTLDAVDRLYSLRVEAEAASFELAAHFADLCSEDCLPRDAAEAPGRERAVRLGGAGTPLVAEFRVAELGARMRMGTWAARHYVADALDVRHRLPLLWAKIRSREARVANVRLVAARTRHLTPEAAAYVDAAMAEHADGSLPWGRFESRLDGKVVAADPDTAAAREAERVREQLARRTRSSEQGTAGFYVRSTAGVIARIDATVAYFAEALAAFGDRDDLDQRRVKAMVLLCNPTRAVELLASYAWLRSAAGPALLSGEPDPELAFDDDAAPGEDEPVPPPDALSRMDAFARRVGFGPTRLPDWLVPRFGPPDAPPDGSRFRFDWSSLLPPLTLNLHLSAADLAAGGGGVARWEGVGPVTHQFVHEHLRPLHRYRIQPVIDLAGMAPVDAYEIPDRLRAAVRLRTPADAFPFSSAVTGPGVAMDEDHTEPFVPATGSRGEKDWATRLGNLAPLGRFHHRIKTHGRWTVRQPFDGIVLWRDPQGQVYLVDHTGTHKVTGPGVAAGGAPPYDPDLDLCPAGDLLVEYLPV